MILVTIDGMRPDAFLACGHPMVEYVRWNASYSMDASSVIPPVTLPAHLSIFYSVPPQRHGTLTNDYVPPVRPFDGLFEQIRHAGKTSAIDLTGKKVVYQLAIPKGDNHVWEDQRITFFGSDWHVVGFETEGIDDLIPLLWNKKVQVERYG